MTRVSRYPLRKEIGDRIFEIFITTLLHIKRKEEAERLVLDFLTPTERIMLAKRLSIAFLLEKGYDYESIKSLLHVSSGTISTVSTARQYGSDGYKQLIVKILKEESIKNVLEEAAIKLLSIPSASSKGGSAYRYVKKELEKKRNKGF